VLTDQVDDAVWQKVSDLRDGELADARADLDAFVKVMRHPTKACARTAFEIIEPHSYAPALPAGVRHAARPAPAPPTHLVAAGLERCWSESGARRTRAAA